MKNLTLFFPTDTQVSSAFEGVSPKIELRENEMLSYIPQDSANIYMVRSLENFLGKNKFLPQFQLKGDTWETYNKDTNVLGDLVYGLRMPPGVENTYPSEIKEITKDKRIVEKLFPKLTIQSIVCHSPEEILQKFNKISSIKKVLKPTHQFAGRGIYIGDAIPDISKFQESDFPYILQEFHDTSSGFYGLCKGLHDFRVVILNGEIIAKILREPPLESYISNESLGGKLHDVSDFKIPKEVQDVIDEVENYCKKYPHRYYSIDMGRGVNGDIKLFEINSAPGFANSSMAQKFGEYTARNILCIL